MSFKIDFVDGDAIAWTLTEDGADAERITDYTPSIYAGVRDGSRETLDWLRELLDPDPKVVATGYEDWYTGLKRDARERMLRIDVERTGDVRSLVREIGTRPEFDPFAPGTFQLYNTDFSPQFRFCLERDVDPTPARTPETLRLDIPEKGLADRDLSTLELEGEPIDGTPDAILRTVARRLRESDPDVLLLSTADLVPFLFEEAEERGIEAFELGRRSGVGTDRPPGYQQLAGESQMETYGQILHSPARYNVVGRAIVDRSNSFMWAKSGLHGLVDLVRRSWKPLQECGWASIGNILTAIQIREALSRGVLVPDQKTQHEKFKSVDQLHQADRGGFTFAPRVGLHESVHELDFSSLYPNVMIQHNISPETVLCPCHPDRDDVPVLDYNVCPDPGFIPDVLEPIVEDRDRIKAEMASADDPAEIERLESMSDALKWILVTCFGYQGYKNSKFGRIEAHEAINAYAREILLAAKRRFEENGWEVVHGIVDSVWVAPREDEAQEPLDDVAAEISEAVGIRLEYENEYDWICFVPMRESNAGALTKYFGSVAGTGEYKVRGVEIRQRSTPEFISKAQRRFMDVLDEERSAESVVDHCQHFIQRLRSGAVDVDDLVITQRVTKPLEAYTQENLNVAALRRYRDHGMEKRPGQDVRYVVVDDDARRSKERVRLGVEAVEDYDADHYVTELVRACESIVSPLGWSRGDIRQYLGKHRDVRLSTFSDMTPP